MNSAYSWIVIGLLITVVHAIHISTPGYEVIYSGPGGVPTPGWDTLVDPVFYSNYLSVAQVCFSHFFSYVNHCIYMDLCFYSF